MEIDRQKEQDVRDNALARPASEREFASRPDRLRPFLLKRMDELSFVEFSSGYLRKSGFADIMEGVPIPIRQGEKGEFESEGGLGLLAIVQNMAMVIGMDPAFPHAGAYQAMIKKIFGKKATGLLSGLAGKMAEDGRFEEACILYRASLALQWDAADAMYGYAMACRSIYAHSEDAERTGRFKAEAFDYFELLTELHPRLGQGWYHLGYMYLNMGLYTKAKLAWEGFLARSGDAGARGEIERRLGQMDVPIEIERGYNAVLSGKWQEGIAILEPFTESAYRDWWPIWHYLGEAYLQAGMKDAAKEAFRQLLRYNGTHTETMESLIDIYREEGDEGMAEKYEGKIRLIRENPDEG